MSDDFWPADIKPPRELRLSDHQLDDETLERRLEQVVNPPRPTLVRRFLRRLRLR